MRRRIVSALSLFFLGGAAAGCVSLAPLKQRDYARVTLRQVEKAGRSSDAEVQAALLGLLEARLARPESIDLDVTLETVSALMKNPAVPSADLLRRAAAQDPREEVRYLALEALAVVGGPGARGFIEEVSRKDASRLVREHAQRLLVEAAVPEARPAAGS